MSIVEAIKTAVEGRNLSIELAQNAFLDIMNGEATEAQIAGLMVALRMKGETVDEITGAATVMRSKATPVLSGKHEFLVDTCGTGGDGAHTFNISTTTAFVAAGAGAAVAKHGNRAVSSRSGSADVLEALGVTLTSDPDVLRACLDDIGICFLFAQALHPAMKYAGPPRKQLGLRSIFNILGPLANPASAHGQLLGVFNAELAPVLAAVLRNLGVARAFVVHGSDGLDELTICGESQVSELRDNIIRNYTVSPEMFGLVRSRPENLTGGDAAQNAMIIRAILQGETGPRRDIVLLNSAFALSAAGIVDDPAEGISKAAASIDSGAALDKLEALIKKTKTTT